MKTHFFCFATALFFSFQMLAQEAPTQTIRGTVVDKDTRQPLIGATVAVTDLAELLGTVTDESGNFTLEKVPVGRQSIECSFLGYADWRAEGLVLAAAHELVLDIELKEDAALLNEVVVKAVASPHQALNDAVVLSARSFSVEEVQHFAGAINDPGRMAHSLPGVQPSKDNEGDLIIRGNASAGVLWRLEGVDILNPNHFARLGGSGGGLTIFSVSVLGTSDFFSGAFPSEYGNALAGVFDMRFRNGNREQRQHSFRAGMLGLEVATEGPFQGKSGREKGESGGGGKGGSYLVNYRYSTLGILNSMGIHLVGERVNNNFQDLSFNLFFPGKNEKSTWRVWGAGGLSFEDRKALDQAEWQVFNDSTRYESGSDVGILGVTHTRTTGERSHLKVSAAVMAQRAFHDQHRRFSDGRAEQSLKDENYLQGKAAVSAFFTQKLSARATFKTGLQVNQLLYDLRYDTIQPDGSLFSYLDDKGSTWQAQPFAQLSLRPGTRWTVNLGVHGFYFDLTKSVSVEPRLSVRRTLGERQSLSLAAGMHSQAVPIGVYFIRQPGNDSSGIYQPNLGLDLMKSMHLVLAYDNLISKQLRLHVEAYTQKLNDVPAAGTFWLLNALEGYPGKQLHSDGEGWNIGFDFSLEKFFNKGLFFILNGSAFDSRYSVGHQEFVHMNNTQFNALTTASLTMGKEWAFGKGGTLQAGLKNLYVNGLPATPLAAGQPSGERPLPDESRPFSERIADYWRTDLRLAWRKGRVSLSLDVQNVLNRKNERAFGWKYDTASMGWKRSMQAGITPVLGCQVDF